MCLCYECYSSINCSKHVIHDNYLCIPQSDVLAQTCCSSSPVALSLSLSLSLALSLARALSLPQATVQGASGGGSRC